MINKYFKIDDCSSCISNSILIFKYSLYAITFRLSFTDDNNARCIQMFVSFFRFSHA